MSEIKQRAETLAEEELSRHTSAYQGADESLQHYRLEKAVRHLLAQEFSWRAAWPLTAFYLPAITSKALKKWRERQKATWGHA